MTDPAVRALIAIKQKLDAKDAGYSDGVRCLVSRAFVEELLDTAIAALLAAGDAAETPRCCCREHMPGGGHCVQCLVHGRPAPNQPLYAASRSPAAPPQEWQPIETAPKDGKPVLLGWPRMVTSGTWTPNRSAWMTERGEYFGTAAPTHWMPLPLPPPAETRRPTEDTP